MVALIFSLETRDACKRRGGSGRSRPSLFSPLQPRNYCHRASSSKSFADNGRYRLRN